MIVLTIKRKWFNMIKSGEKKEEYREIKPYYKTRFYNAIKKELDKETFAQQVKCKCIFKGKGTGKPEWGAEPNKEYYILEILEIVGGNDE